MPYIEEDKLAALYQEVENERKSADFFRQLHENNKQNLANKRIYVLGFYALLLLLIALGLFTVFSPTETISDEKKSANLDLISEVETLRKENTLLKSKGTDLQNVLRSREVYTVQLLASSNEQLALFSDKFVNFRVHSMNDFYAYSLGNFATEEEAESFRIELVKIGFPDGWVTIYKENERILINRE